MSLFGNVPGYEITEGEMLVKGRPMRFRHPYDAIENGVAYAYRRQERQRLDIDSGCEV